MKVVVNAELIKSLNKKKDAAQLNYFKKELIKVLEKNDEEIVSKAIEDYDNSIKKTYSEIGIEKAGYGIGTVRVWKGQKFRKIAPGKWRRIYDSNTRGARQSINIIKKKIANAQSIDELLQLVMENTNRFMDADGKLLPIVEELQNAVKESKGLLNTGKPSTQDQIEQFKKENNKDEKNVKDIKKLPKQTIKRLQNFISYKDNSLSENFNNAYTYLTSEENKELAQDFIKGVGIKSKTELLDWLIKNALYGDDKAIEKFQEEKNYNEDEVNNKIDTYIKINNVDNSGFWAGRVSDYVRTISDSPFSNARVEALEKMLDLGERVDLFKLYFSKAVEKPVTDDNYIEVACELAVKMGMPFNKVQRIMKKFIKRRDALKRQQENFIKYHGEPVKRDLSNNEIYKANNFDEIDHSFENMGIDFDKSLKMLDFESVKKSCVGIVEFMKDFPFPEGMKLQKIVKKDGNKTKGYYMVAECQHHVFGNRVLLPYSIGISADSYKKNVQKDIDDKKRYGIKGKYFHAGDGIASLESFGYHEMAHELNFIFDNYNITSEKIINEAYENVKDQLDNMSLDDAKKTISGYALENDYETFAEAFADYYLYGEKNCSPISKEIVNIAIKKYNEIVKEKS